MSGFAQAAPVALVAGAALATGGAVAWSAVEAARLEIEHLRFRVAERGLVFEGRTTLPAGGGACPDGRPARGGGLRRPGGAFRLAHLTDLHLHRRPGRSHRDALRCIEALGAHLAVVTGDLMDAASRPAAALQYLLELQERVQVAVVWGNHDHERPRLLAELAQALERAGAWVLSNRHVWLQTRALGIRLVGVDAPDLRRDRYAEAVGRPPLLRARWDDGVGAWVAGLPQEGEGGQGPHDDPDGSERGGTGGPMQAHVEVVAAHSYHVIEHHPAVMPEALVIVGDTHGGQIDLPLLGPVWARWVHGHRFVRGLFRVGPVWLYVNRGVGTIGVPLRLRCRPELAVIDLTAPGGPS